MGMETCSLGDTAPHGGGRLRLVGKHILCPHDPAIPHPREPAAGHQRHNSNNDEIHPRVPVAAAGAGVSCGLDSPAASGGTPPTTQNPNRLTLPIGVGGGPSWDRTSDLSGVNGTLFH